jgi:hypothetical protein
MPSRPDHTRSAAYQQNADGSWTPAVPLRRATWLEVILDRWIGPRHGDHPWRCVLKGLLRRV